MPSFYGWGGAGTERQRDLPGATQREGAQPASNPAAALTTALPLHGGFRVCGLSLSEVPYVFLPHSAGVT